MRVSVCLASFNGARFIAEQIGSILPQLGPDDELIIVDDHSRDNTREVIRRFQDKRITLLSSPRQQGHVTSFARAIEQADGDIIVLSDQDDIWTEGRQAKIRQLFRDHHCALVAGNFLPIDDTGAPLTRQLRRLRASDSGRSWANIAGIFLGRRPYYGCAMAFAKPLKPLLLPIPAFVESHDLWVAMAANLTGAVQHTEEPLLAKRFHGDNVSCPKRRSWPVLIVSRVKFLAGLILLFWRARRRKVNSAR